MQWFLLLSAAVFSVFLMGGEARAEKNYVYSVKAQGTYYYSRSSLLLKEVNKLRETEGKNALQMDEDLEEEAMLRSLETSVVFSHKRPDGSSWRTVSETAQTELIAAGPVYAKQIFAFLNLEQARKNTLISGRWNKVGIGCFGQGKSCYWVLLFSSDDTESSFELPKDQISSGYVTISENVMSVQLAVQKTNSISTRKNRGSITLEQNKQLVLLPVRKEKRLGKYLRLNTEQFSWKSSDPKIAKIVGKGVLKTRSPGTALITAVPANKAQWKDKEAISVYVKVRPKTFRAVLRQKKVKYSGEEQKPGVVVKSGKTILKEGRDYHLRYRSNIKRGTGRVYVFGKKKYKGENKVLEFLII